MNIIITLYLPSLAVASPYLLRCFDSHLTADHPLDQMVNALAHNQVVNALAHDHLGNALAQEQLGNGAHNQVGNTLAHDPMGNALTQSSKECGNECLKHMRVWALRTSSHVLCLPFPSKPVLCGKGTA